MAEEEKVKATLVFEILGRPKEHLIESLEKLIEVVGKENGIKIEKKKIHEPKLLEQKDKEGKIIEAKQETFTSFAEVELEAKHIMDLLRIMFAYMPSHIEIFKPEKFGFSNADFNSISNEILRMLHHYDSIAKSAIINNQILMQRMKEYVKKIKAEKETSEKNQEKEKVE